MVLSCAVVLFVTFESVYYMVKCGHAIALFTVNVSHLHNNVFERGCEAISGNFALFARNCLTSTFKYIVMQMRKGNCEKGYWKLLYSTLWCCFKNVV